MITMRPASRLMIFKGTRDSPNDGHENLMMIMRTTPRIVIFKEVRDSLNDGHENLMMILRTLNDGHEFSCSSLSLMMVMRTL